MVTNSRYFLAISYGSCIRDEADADQSSGLKVFVTSPDYAGGSRPWLASARDRRCRYGSCGRRGKPPGCGNPAAKPSADADAILTNIMDRVDLALLDARTPPQGHQSDGGRSADNVDVAEAPPAAVCRWATLPSVLAKATPDAAFALLMSERPAYRPKAKDGFAAVNGRLAFHRPALAGRGRSRQDSGHRWPGPAIGLEMAKRGHGFDMKILYNSRTRRHGVGSAARSGTMPTCLPSWPSPTLCPSTFP